MNNFTTPTWPIDAHELRTLMQGERFICLFSGGKDSGLALLKAMDMGHPMALIQCATLQPNQSYFHRQPVEIAQKQAHALGIPLHICHATPWEQPTQIIELYRSYADQGVQSVVFGDWRLEQNARWQAALCIQAGLIPRMPLWQLDSELLLSEMQRRKMQSVITWVNPQKLPQHWLGHIYDSAAYRAFQHMGIDPLGENGEFHTTLVYCNLFAHAIDLDLLNMNRSL